MVGFISRLTTTMSRWPRGPRIACGKEFSTIRTIVMIPKNILFILRRFGRQKLTTSLHITGLTLGITVCMLIGLFIKYELSFDGYQSKANRTYRVNQVWVDFGKKIFHYSTPFPLADQIRKDVPGLENVTKVHHPV